MCWKAWPYGSTIPNIRLHHFPTRWPSRLEFIIITAVVQGNKSVLLFRKRPVIGFVSHLHLWQVPRGENRAWKEWRLFVGEQQVPVNNMHRRSTRTRRGYEPEEDETSDTFISIKDGRSLELINALIQRISGSQVPQLRKMLITNLRVLFQSIIPLIFFSCWDITLLRLCWLAWLCSRHQPH